MGFEEIYRAHFPFVWRSLLRLGVRESDAADAAQEVFVVVHRKLAEFEGRSKLTTWLFGVCLRVAQSRLRLAHERREVLDERFLLALPTEREDALAEIERRQGMAIVEAIVQRMSLEQRTVFILFELEGMSSEEIAEALAIPRGTVQSRLRLARQSF